MRSSNVPTLPVDGYKDNFPFAMNESLEADQARRTVLGVVVGGRMFAKAINVEFCDGIESDGFAASGVALAAKANGPLE